MQNAEKLESLSAAMFAVDSKLEPAEQSANHNLADCLRAMSHMDDEQRAEYKERVGDLLRSLAAEALPALDREAPEVAKQLRESV